MKNVKVLLLSVMMLFYATNSFSQSLTIKWDASPVLDFEGNELPLFAAIEVIIPTDGLTKHVPDAGNLFLLGEPLLNGNPSMANIELFGNPLPYFSASINPIASYNSLNITGLLPGPGETKNISLYLRVWDNIHYDTSFDGSGNFLGHASLIDPNKYNNGVLSYYFETAIQTFSFNGDSPNFTQEYIFNISGMQTNLSFPAAGPVPEPSAMMLAGFGLLYMIRKFRRQ